ncbi:hypothetical protein RF11_05403 [Thelohanellus kitauei]|uniref:Uncharacterized protein n=1 Tax=Thelohanellus kitauei TaxID=669202 RepID=A0A0C2MSR0_THEKT|nr:hypothetical protein RF11_05403 [Thelohanellus kitauei]
MSYRNVDYEINKQAIHLYIKRGSSQNLQTVEQAVRTFISHFSSQPFSNHLFVFIIHFPKKLHDEFKMASEVTQSGTRDHQQTILFFEVFTFIFKYQQMASHSRAVPFVELFLNFIKTYDNAWSLDVHALFNSIQNCVTHDTNKLLFINENGMYNFYCYFQVPGINICAVFRILCQRICEIFKDNCCGISPIQISQYTDLIMNKFSDTKRKDISWMLLTFLKMIHRLGLFDQIDLNVPKFYTFTHSMFFIDIKKSNYRESLQSVSKIWGCIFNGSRNSFQIDNIDKLALMAAIFAIDLSAKLNRVIYGFYMFKLSKNKKLKLYILYLTLVAFPTIDHAAYPWLRFPLNNCIFPFKNTSRKH